jgi:raffinose/stachyose/melibiose transport system permease protein
MAIIQSSSRSRVKRKTLAVLKYAILIIIALTNLFPFWWTLLSSVKDTNEIITNSFALPQRVVKWSNYRDSWVSGQLSVAFINTTIVAGVSVVAILLVSSMAAYIVARVRKSLLLYSFFTLGIMVPVQALIVPLFIEMKLFHLTNTRAGLSLVYVAVNFSLCFFILYGFLKTIPSELEEAAVIDGAGNARVFFQIILPIAKPGLATVGIFALLHCWNEFLIPLVLITDSSRNVISQGISNLKGAFVTDYGLLCAGIVIAAIPVVILYILFQEQVVKGMTAGALKG